MTTFKWRISLSLLNLAAAIGFSVLGMSEYNAFRESHFGVFHEGSATYIPTAQLVSYFINAPSFVFSNLLGNARMWRSLWGDKWLGGYVFHNVNVSFYVTLLMFWWWIGWIVDFRGRHNRSTLASLGWVITGLLSLALAFGGIDILRTSEFPSGNVPGGRAIPISMLVWGFGLSAYCAALIARSRSRRKSQAERL
jgi:hypothetical protein